jgi:High-temperature-induced dauer-formation protein
MFPDVVCPAVLQPQVPVRTTRQPRVCGALAGHHQQHCAVPIRRQPASCVRSGPPSQSCGSGALRFAWGAFLGPFAACVPNCERFGPLQLAKLKVAQPGTAPDGDAVSTTGSEGKPDGDHGVEPEGKAQTGTSIAPADNAATQEARRAHEDRVEHGGFVPTAEWLASWKGKLQLGTVMRLIDVLGPQVEAFVSKTDGVPDEEVVMSFIRKTTMVGALPVPHAIITRRYQPNHYTALWFTTFLWGVIFLRNQRKCGLIAP